MLDERLRGGRRRGLALGGRGRAVLAQGEDAQPVVEAGDGKPRGAVRCPLRRLRGLGQIENLSKFSEPDIAVITNIGSSHIGILGSKENITNAKCEITKHLNPKGVVIIPANDLLLEETLKKNWNGRIIKVELIDRNQKARSINKSNLQGFFNRSNNKSWVMISKKNIYVKN